MEIEYKPMNQVRVPRYAKKIARKAPTSKIVGAKLTGGKLTAGKLNNFFKENEVHPDVVKRLKGAGFFDNIVNGIKKATKFVMDNKDNIEKGIKFGKQAIDAGKQGYDLYKSLKGGKLNPKMKKRSEAMGKLMKGSRYNMSDASKIYKIMEQGKTMQEAERLFNSRK
jgi:hypothetical protein